MPVRRFPAPPPLPASTRRSMRAGSARARAGRSDLGCGSGTWRDDRSCAAPRVWDAQPVKQAGFGHLHAARGAGMIVIVAAKMQRAMHDEVGEMIGHALAGRGRLAANDAKGEYQLGC